MIDAYRIRTSDRANFKRCRLRWDFSSPLRQDYEPLVVNKNLEFGTAIHAGLESYYNLQSQSLDARTYLAIASFIACNDEQLKDNPHSSDVEVERDYEERKELGVGMLQYYCGEWAPYNDKFTVLAVEHHFEVPVLMPEGWRGYLPDGFQWHQNIELKWPQLYCWSDKARNFVPVIYEGTIDLIVEDEDGEVWIMDHKTAAAFKDDTFHLDVDTQVTSYAWAAQFFIDKPIAGVIYNQVKKAYPKEPKLVYKGKQLSKDKSQSTTKAFYERAIEEHGFNRDAYEDHLEWLENNEPTFVRRFELHRSESELASQAGMIYNETVDMLSSPSIYPNPGEMVCRDCPFKGPCLATIEQSDPQFILEDPLTYRKREHESV